MSASLPALRATWEEQQAAYVAHRELRFDVMLDVLALTQRADFVAIDLASGPGSLSARVLTRFPDATIVAVDHDPVLLRIAEGALAEHAERFRAVDADLADPGWVETLDAPRVDAVLSSTALHWLMPDQLVRVYAQLAGLLRAGGVLLNADHLRFDARHPTLRRAAEAHDQATQRLAFEAGAKDWDEWWADIDAHPELGPLRPLRDRRFSSRPTPPPTSPDIHLAALRQAGFGEVSTVWQHLDDYVIAAVR